MAVQSFAEPTRNQVSALHSYSENQAVPEPIRYGISEFLSSDRMTYQMASDIIGMLREWLQQQAEQRATQPGIYLDPGTQTYYQVKRSGQGRLYAMKLHFAREGKRNEADDGWDEEPLMEWIFTPGAINKINSTWKITKEQAKAFGDYFHKCIKCHTKLTKPSSIAQGMGDICASYI
jgi:hypothetical protein